MFGKRRVMPSLTERILAMKEHSTNPEQSAWAFNEWIYEIHIVDLTKIDEAKLPSILVAPNSINVCVRLMSVTYRPRTRILNCHGSHVVPFGARVCPIFWSELAPKTEFKCLVLTLEINYWNTLEFTVMCGILGCPAIETLQFIFLESWSCCCPGSTTNCSDWQSI